jgi:hypothetical protein
MEQRMSNQLVTSIPSPQEIETLTKLGNMAVRSGFLPQSIKTPEQAVIIMLKGKELNIPPMQAFSSIAVVNGKPTIGAELMLTLIYKNIPGAIVDYLETSNKVCTIEAKRPGGKPSKFSFSIEDAKQANLLGKSVWTQYPAAMLRARCISIMARAMFPDALAGVVYTPEELGAEVDDEGEIVDVTPPKEGGAKEPEGKPLTQSQSLPKPSEEKSMDSAPSSTSKKSDGADTTSSGKTNPAMDRLEAARVKGKWLKPQITSFLKGKFGVDRVSVLTEEEFNDLVKTVENNLPTDAFAKLANKGTA